MRSKAASERHAGYDGATPTPTPDKGTTAWHRISAAGAVFPSASVNGQARCIALTPFVPLSREAGEGERAAGRTAARSYTPLPQRGRGAGGEGKKWAPPAHSEPKRCTLISTPTLPARGEGDVPPPCTGEVRRGAALILTALPKFVNAQDSNPPSPRPSPPLTRGERAGSGGILHTQEFVNFDDAIGITPTALPKFVNAQDSNPPSPRPSPPLTRGERAGSGGILHAQEVVISDGAMTARSKFTNCPPPLGSPRSARGTEWVRGIRFPLRAGGT
jgi:hypothetical protein